MDLQQLTIHPFPTASMHETFLLEAKGRFFEIGKDTAEILKYLQTNGMAQNCIRRYVEEHGGKPKIEEIENFLASFGKQLDCDENSSGDRRRSFLYHKDFISATVLRRYSDILKYLFSPWLMWIVVTVFCRTGSNMFFPFPQYGRISSM